MSKLVYGQEWVKVRNMMNRRFRANAPCSLCRTLKCEMVWYSIRTKEARCRRCFTPGEPGGLCE